MCDKQQPGINAEKLRIRNKKKEEEEEFGY